MPEMRMEGWRESRGRISKGFPYWVPMAHIQCLVSVSFPLLLTKWTRSPWFLLKPWFSSDNCTLMLFLINLAATVSSFFCGLPPSFHSYWIFVRYLCWNVCQINQLHGWNPYMFIKGVLSTLPSILPVIFSIMICTTWGWIFNHQLKVLYRCNYLPLSKTLEKQWIIISNVKSQILRMYFSS